MRNIKINSTGAIGDLVIASALVPELSKLDFHTTIKSKGFTLSLWDNIENASAVSELEEEYFDISDYLSHMPHSRALPSDYEVDVCRFGHLSEWMAVTFRENSGIEIKPSRDNVNVVLTKEEVDKAKDRIYEHGKKVVIISPFSTTRNRDIPQETLDEIVHSLQDKATLLFSRAPGDERVIDGTIPIEDYDLRNVAANLYVADAFIGVDSGPLHMINGALQGTNKEYGTNLNLDKSKVIAVLGSSHPSVVTYDGNTTVFNIPQTPTSDEILADVCPVYPCGSHGYASHERIFEFHDINKEEFDLPCIDPKYENSAYCMRQISPEEIIEKTLLHI